MSDVRDFGNWFFVRENKKKLFREFVKTIRTWFARIRNIVRESVKIENFVRESVNFFVHTFVICFVDGQSHVHKIVPPSLVTSCQQKRWFVIESSWEGAQYTMPFGIFAFILCSNRLFLVFEEFFYDASSIF